VGVSRDCPNFLSILSGVGKATNFKFCMHIHRTDQNKKRLKMCGKVDIIVVSDSQNFSGHLYIWCIAQSSLR